MNLKPNINLFELRVKLYPPDYLAGLTIENLTYEVYLGDGGDSVRPNFIAEVNASGASKGVHIELRKDFINGLGTLKNIYYLTVALKFINDSVANLVALPVSSPHLRFDPICTLFGEAKSNIFRYMKLLMCLLQ